MKTICCECKAHISGPMVGTEISYGLCAKCAGKYHKELDAHDKATRASYKEKREAWGRYADNVNRRATTLAILGHFLAENIGKPAWVCRYLAAKRAILAEDRAAGRQGGNYAV